MNRTSSKNNIEFIKPTPKVSSQNIKFSEKETEDVIKKNSIINTLNSSKKINSTGDKPKEAAKDNLALSPVNSTKNISKNNTKNMENKSINNNKNKDEFLNNNSNKLDNINAKSSKINSINPLKTMSLSLTSKHRLLPKMISYKDYTTAINTRLKFYKSKSEKILPIMEQEDSLVKSKTMNIINPNEYKLINKDEKSTIKNIVNRNKRYYGNYYNFKSLIDKEEKRSLIEDPFNITLHIRFPHNSLQYKNPYESLDILKNNLIIYEDITKNAINRQKMLYDKSMKAMENIKEKNKKKRVKVTQLYKKKIKKLLGIDDDNLNDSEENIDYKLNNAKDFLKKIIKPKNNLSTAKLYCYYKYPNKNFPECRESFTLTLKDRADLILIGGISSYSSSSFIWSLNIDSMEWSRINAKNYPLNPNKFGHTAILYLKKIFTFGGRTKLYNDETEITTEVLNGLEYFDLEDKCWYQPTFPPKIRPILRRDHISFLLGHYMIIHGGVDENLEVLNDIFALNLNFPLKWEKLNISLNDKPPFLFGHAGALVIPSKILTGTKFNIYKLPEGLETKNDNFLITQKLTGYYIFGGKSKVDENKSISNALYRISVGKRPIEFQKINNFNGVPPSPRYYHSMNYYEKKNYLIIHGGRNDSLSDNYALSDTFIFNLYKLEWTRIELFSNMDNFRLINRCGHQSEIYENKLIIIGGKNSNNYVGSSMFIIALNVDEIKKVNIFCDKPCIADLLQLKNNNISNNSLIIMDNNNNFNEVDIEFFRKKYENKFEKNKFFNEILSKKIEKKFEENQIGVLNPHLKLPNIK